VPSTFSKTVLEPADARTVVPALERSANPNVWVYRYRHASRPWRLSIATHAAPGSKKLSLGGFRIAPAERTALPTFDPDREAIELAIGMEEKVYWSRLIGAGGPLARRDMGRIVGGKCVLEPTTDARVGQPHDAELLDFAIACLNDCERSAGIHIATGQDLGHGVMSDRRTPSLAYLNRGFPGSVVADTSQPTGEGNYCVLRGMLRGLDIDVSRASVGLIGIGNIGKHIVDRLCDTGARMIAVEARPERRAELAKRGIRVFSPEDKGAFLRTPMDALVVNAAGGSLDSPTVDACVGNERLRAICGSENLVMPNPRDAERLHAARKVYCPTELGGMMGYLTAVEEYLAQLEGAPFVLETLFEAAKQLEVAAFEATKAVMESGFGVDFENAVRGVRG